MFQLALIQNDLKLLFVGQRDLDQAYDLDLIYEINK